MKKLFILAAAVIAMASCGNKTTENNSDADSTAVVADSIATDAATEADIDNITTQLDKQVNAKDAKSIETTLTAAKAHYDALVKAGKTEEAAQYASKLKDFYEKNAEAIKTVTSGNTTVNDLVNGIVNLPSSVNEAAKAATNAAESDANAAINGAKNAANTVKENAKQTVKNAENNAKQAVSNAKKDAEDKAKNAVSNAKQKTRDAANKAVNDALNKAFGN